MPARRDHCFTRADDRHARDSAITDRTLLVGVFVYYIKTRKRMTVLVRHLLEPLAKRLFTRFELLDVGL